MRRPPIWQLCCLTLTMVVIVVGYLHLGESEQARLREYIDNAKGSLRPTPESPPAPVQPQEPRPPVQPTPAKPAEIGQTPTTSSPSDASRPTDAPPTTSPPPEHAKEKPINATLMEMAPAYVKAIMNPFDTHFSRLDCPALDQVRYAGLRISKSSNYYASGKADKAAEAADDEDAKPKKVMYYFTLNLRGAAHILPRLLSSVVTAIRYLGRGSCMLTIVEGNSDDGTWEILTALVPELRKHSIRFNLKTSTINPTDDGSSHRIERLAELRNLALEPLTSADPATIDKDATVIFLNDVAACPEDILELVYQKKYQEADMTCAMDWSYMLRNPTFYDAWIARTMKGETFFHIPDSGSWQDAWHMFWNDDETNRHFEFHQPFQVYSCWNGGVAFSAKLILGEDGIRFRHSQEPEECYQGEPTLFCKDMWRRKMGRIAVVPTINLVYTDADGRKIKQAKGFVNELVNEDTDTKIEWKPDPPEKVKCWREYSNQMWTPWDQGGPKPIASA